MRVLRGTVGVAPGTYTLQLGASPVCPPDGWGTGAYGVPRVGWYDTSAGSQVNQIMNSQALDPYGTDSTLRGRNLFGLADITDSPPTVMGVRLDILGAVLGVAAVVAFGVGFLATR